MKKCNKDFLYESDLGLTIWINFPPILFYKNLPHPSVVSFEQTEPNLKVTPFLEDTFKQYYLDVEFVYQVLGVSVSKL